MHICTYVFYVHIIYVFPSSPNSPFWQASHLGTPGETIHSSIVNLQGKNEIHWCSITTILISICFGSFVLTCYCVQCFHNLVYDVICFCYN